jgi:hypothetical protein
MKDVTEFVLDLECFPLVIMRFNKGGMTDADVDQLIAGFTELYQRRTRYGIVGFAGGLRAAPNIRQRKKLAEWENSTRHLVRAWCVATALVIDSAIARGAVTAMRWISPAPSPEIVTSTELEAMEWVVPRMRAERLPGMAKAEALYERIRSGRS